MSARHWSRDDVDSPPEDRRHVETIASAAAAAMFLGVNGGLLLRFSMEHPHGFFLIGFAFLFAPLLNLGLMFATVACNPLVESWARGNSTALYFYASFVLPVVATVADFFVVMNCMELHGC